MNNRIFFYQKLVLIGRDKMILYLAATHASIFNFNIPREAFL